MPNDTGFSKLLDFEDVATGRLPGNSLISNGTFLYGMAGNGGTNDLGTIFKIKPDGSEFSKLMDFNGSTNGSYPRGSFIFEGPFLYATTFSGGVSNRGTIFRVKSDGSTSM